MSPPRSVRPGVSGPSAARKGSYGIAFAAALLFIAVAGGVGGVVVTMAPAQNLGDVVIEPAQAEDLAGGGKPKPARAAKAAKPKKAAANLEIAAVESKSDWIKRCGKTKSGEQRCQIEHLIVDGKQRQVVRFAVMLINEQQTLSVWSPVGLLIPFGVHIKIDKAESRQLQLVSCDGKSCLAVVGLDKKLLQELSAGTQIAVIMKDSASGKDLAVTGSLQGFKATYASVFKAVN